MAEETIQLTKRALHRLKAIQAVIEKRLKQKEAARQLGITTRQVKRRVAKYKQEGPQGPSIPPFWETIQPVSKRVAIRANSRLID